MANILKISNYKDEFSEIFDNLEKQQYICDTIDKKLDNLFAKIFEITKVPVLDKSEDNPYNEDDFPLVSENAIIGLDLVLQSIKKIVFICKNKKFKVVSNHCINSLAVCSVAIGAQYYNADTFWSCTEASILAQNLLKLLLVATSDNITALCVLYGSKSLESQQLSTDDDKYKLGLALKPLLQHLGNKLTKQNWKNDPGSRELYLWLMSNLQVIISYYIYNYCVASYFGVSHIFN